MENRLVQLEKLSRQLEPLRDERELLQKLAVQYSNQFLDEQQDAPAYTPFTKNVVNTLLEDPITEAGVLPGEALKIFGDQVVPPGLNLTSGRHFGYIPGGGLSVAAIGDYLAAVTNRYAGVYSSSPGAVALETRMIYWLAELFGYPETSGGYLASGGSHANLTAIVAARDSKKLKAADFSKAVVYITAQTHHCVARALNIAGMSECVHRYIPMDDQFRMVPEKLDEAISEDLNGGLIPWLIVASAGSTDAGAVDPLADIAVIARKHGLWFHVDAAYGGFFMLTEKGKRMLKGIEESDSLVVDPHKGLFLPYGTGALLVKEAKKIAFSHRFEASYMNDTKVDSGMYSPAEISPELSKHFRAVRMWLPLKIHGITALRAALEEKLLLAKYLSEKLEEMDQIETGPAPQLSVVMFRWTPDPDEIVNDELNRSLHKLLLEDGRIFLSTTQIGGRFFFRAAILSARTHLSEVDTLLSVLREKKEELLKSL
ncbi:MAG: aminotransferase class V-fold PLP-dependent enzyme [Balneolaceae bacterium]|nr:aminotransferase class V-fold PLP-dependent enzyme [Balneolaceae bacterium]